MGVAPALLAQAMLNTANLPMAAPWLLTRIVLKSLDAAADADADAIAQFLRHQSEDQISGNLELIEERLEKERPETNSARVVKSLAPPSVVALEPSVHKQ